MKRSKQLHLLRDPECTLCPLSAYTEEHEDICSLGAGSLSPKVMVVSKMPNSPKYTQIINKELTKLGVEQSEIFHTSAVKCRTWEKQPSRKNVKVCSSHYLEKEIDILKPKWILALGNEALQATTGKSGITKYRGKIFKYNEHTKVFPTVSPAMVLRNPRYRAGWEKDLAFFINGQVRGSGKVKLPKIHYVFTKEDVKELIRLLKRTQVVSYDVETTGVLEFDVGAAIVSLSVTMLLDDNSVTVWSIPLYHPESPFRSWTKLLAILRPYLEAVPKTVGQNGKFDARWLRQFGVKVGVSFDTMLVAHLLDENRPKGLKSLARTLLGAPAWDIDTKNLLDTPLEKVLKYNGLDTYWTYKLYKELKSQLLEQPRLLRLYLLLLKPANEQLIDIERRGIWIDREKLASHTKIAYDTLQDIEDKILEWVPDELPDHLPSKKGEVINFNPSNFARWFLFEHLELPVIRRGVNKEDGSPGNPSMAEDVLLELRDEHPVVNLMLERSRWQKITSGFLEPYNELIGENDRIHTVFKLWGTVTGRLSSGKIEEEKITGRVQNRGINIQQTPRDPFVRGLFGAAPGYTFVEADFSQIELRIVAFLSREPTMLRLYQTGEDIHLSTASWIMGKPTAAISSSDRKKAKAVNFGFVYGMGAKKFIYTAFTKYELRFTLHEAKDIRKKYLYELYPGLPKWHARQRELVRKYKRVVSPLGRVRHLPDIDSPDQSVKAEAERQAINSPVQSFASDLTLLAMVLLNDKFAKAGIDGLGIGLVHDANLFEIKTEHLPIALPMIKDTMENLPLRKKFGVDVDVPLTVDIKIGKYWGEARELTPHEIYNYGS